MVRQRWFDTGAGGILGPVQTSPLRPPVTPDDIAADQQSGWVTLGLYALGVAIYVFVGMQFLGLINFPPFMLACLLLTGWAGPRLWRRLHR